jgi:hypothetical protein
MIDAPGASEDPVDAGPLAAGSLDAVDAVVATARRLTAARLRAPLSGPVPTRADAARLLARVLATSAQGIEAAGAPEPPRWRTLPELPDLGVGDQLAVLAHDFRHAVATATSALVWTPDGRVPLADVVRDVAATAAEVGRML